MYRVKRNILLNCRKTVSDYLKRNNATAPSSPLPSSADVVIIGGGSAGCHTLYHLAKNGVKAVLLERGKLTAGTTWHTAGLVWRLRPSDVDIELLARSRNMLMTLEEETGVNPGWIQNGGLFIAHDKVRMDEYRRLATIGNAMGIENHLLTPEESKKIFPLLNAESFYGALYSPGDGIVDPAMLVNSLTKSAKANGGKVIENCPVEDLVVEKDAIMGKQKITGVQTANGVIKTEVVVNATGVWGRDLTEKYGVHLPLIPMKHAYVVTQPIPEIRGMPNIRDHDYSIYFKIQGETIQMGGYEDNPIYLNRVPNDFLFGLYELDYSTFEKHIQGAADLCPKFGTTGIKSTVCGPESFTPDHKPLMGPDPRLSGLFHNCGFNSAGMMFGGGCGEQIAKWIINGTPEFHMFNFDVKRYTPDQTANLKWAEERSHESFAKNYSKIFPHDQPLSGRNFKKDPLHDRLLSSGAVMEEKQGWERPGFFLKNEVASVLPYDWYGNYGYTKHESYPYEEKLLGDCSYEFSEHHNLIGEEALNCRKNAAIFNMCYFGKYFLTGPDAQRAADWIFTADTNKEINKTVYTCALNKFGGTEGDVTVTPIEPGTGEIHNPMFTDRGFYIVAGGSSSYHTEAHLKTSIQNKGFKATVVNVTDKIGVISIQGPNSRAIMEKLSDIDFSNENFPPNSAKMLKIKDSTKQEQYSVRALRVSFVGELGYELHIPNELCTKVYNTVMSTGATMGLRNAGYRALYSLSGEKGYHLWGFDLRSSDTPVEANLGFVCRSNGEYNGKSVIDEQKKEGVRQRLVFLKSDKQLPIWGLEGIYRNGEPVGHLRRAQYGYSLDRWIGQAYLKRKDNGVIDVDFIKAGEYEIDIMGKRHPIECLLRSSFDPKGKRILGDYN